MKKLVGVLLGVLLIFFTLNSSAKAESVKHGLLVVELQTGSSQSASEEFIELFNQTEESLNLADFRLEYFSASSVNFDNPSRVINLSGTLYPDGRYLVASSGYLTAQADTQFSPTLAKTGGHIRVVNSVNSVVTIHDLVGWGSASHPESQAAPTPDSGQSLQRKVTSLGYYQDTDDNFEDLVISIPSPESNNPLPPAPEEPAPVDPLPEPTPEPGPENPEPPVDPNPEIALPEEPELVILITELLPNPGSPCTDDNNEFIELYNPNSQTVNLKNYRLETGKDFSYDFTLGDVIILPGQYITLYSKDTNLVLSNTSGRARLLNPVGNVVSETSMYDEAKDNMSWSLIDGTWQWTSSPTPNLANVFVIPTTSTTASATKKAATAKPKAAAAKKASTAKPKAASSKAAKAKAASTKKANDGQQAEKAKTGVSGPVHPLVLAAVGVLALGYAGYEYRSDIANKFRQLRGQRKNWPTSGAAS